MPVSRETYSAEHAVFWKNRYERFGHTGWSDSVIYAYDQLERLELVRRSIAPPPSGSLALDFGCGTGDFSRLLLSFGFRVCGYDPFIKPSIRSKLFHYARHFNQIPFDPSTVRCVLSITTLDHVLDQGELLNALKVIRHLLRGDGILYMLEYSLDSTHAPNCFRRNEYQAFRRLDEWRSLLSAVDLEVVSCVGAPHPIAAPSKGYLEYANGYAVGFARLLSRFRFPILPIQSVLRWHAQRCLARSNDDMGCFESSPLRIMLCAPVAHAT